MPKTKIVSPKVTPKANKAYIKLVDTVASDLRKFHASGLQFYWAMGNEVKQLVESPSNYGGHTVELFCADINSRCDSSFSPSTVYKAISFHKLIGKDQLDMMIASGVAWRNVIPLLRSDLTEEEREKIIASVAGNTLQQGKIADEVASLREAAPKSGERKEKPRTNSFGILLQTHKRLEEVADMVAGIRALVDDVLEDSNEEDKENLSKLVGDIDATVKELNTAWTDDKPEIDEALSITAEPQQEREEMPPSGE